MRSLLFVALLIGALIMGLFWLFPAARPSSDYSYAHLAYLALLLCYLGLGVSWENQQWKQNLSFAAIWLVLLFVFVLGYSYRAEFVDLKDRMLGNLLPSHAQRHEDGAIMLRRAEGGHFYFTLSVNRTPVRFMVDTGASNISLSKKDAARVGIDVTNLRFNQPTLTANGTSMSAHITLDSIGVDGVVFYDQPATVARNLSGNSLLGMAFLDQFHSVQIEGDILTLVP